MKRTVAFVIEVDIEDIEDSIVKPIDVARSFIRGEFRDPEGTYIVPRTVRVVSAWRVGEGR